MDTAPVQSVLTTDQWLTLLLFFLGGEGVLVLIIYNNVIGRFKKGDDRFDNIDETMGKQGRNIARICTKLGVEEET